MGENVIINFLNKCRIRWQDLEAHDDQSDFAIMLSSGISPYISDEESGPTEKFIHNYGTRVHHMAFNTDQIENTFSP